MRRSFLKAVSLAIFSAYSLYASQCEITSPLPVPVLLSGCTYSGSLPPNSTSYIQNTLSPTTTGQLFSVQQGTFSYSETLGYLTGTSQCLQTDTNGNVLGTGAVCGSGGGGGSSSLAVYTGIPALATVQVSSPTSLINFDQSTMAGALEGATTAYISVQAGISNPTASFTIGSTSTVILANCSLACTMTLPTAIGIAGKRFMIQQQSSVVTGPVTIATTSSQLINGMSSYTVSVASASIDLVSDNVGWQIE